MKKEAKIEEILKKRTDIVFAYLFGSRAKGIAGKRSDWDIAIYFTKDPKKLPIWTLFYLEAVISSTIGEEVQIVALNNLDSPVFLFQIIKDGILLVDNNPDPRIMWETKALRQYHDWQYYLKRQMERIYSVPL